jgi:hypothetical protein
MEYMFDDIIKKRRLLKATWTFELKQDLKKIEKEEDELWDADPNCKHDIKCAPDNWLVLLLRRFKNGR